MRPDGLGTSQLRRARRGSPTLLQRRLSRSSNGKPLDVLESVTPTCVPRSIRCPCGEVEKVMLACLHDIPAAQDRLLRLQRQPGWPAIAPGDVRATRPTRRWAQSAGDVEVGNSSTRRTRGWGLEAAAAVEDDPAHGVPSWSARCTWWRRAASKPAWIREVPARLSDGDGHCVAGAQAPQRRSLAREIESVGQTPEPSVATHAPPRSTDTLLHEAIANLSRY